MASEKLKKWIKRKREEGISDERIKKSLDKTGYDPSIVDELDDPFDGDNSDNEPSEDLFNTDDQGSDGSEKGFSGDSRKERVQDMADNLSDKNSEENNTKKEKTKKKEKQEDKDSSFLDGLEFDLPSFSLPSKPDLPKINTPSVPSISRRKIIMIFALLIVLGGGFTVYSFIPDDFNPRLLLGPDLDSSTSIQTLNQLDAKYSGCPDAGVTIQNISKTDSSTTVDVLVTDEAWVVVEIKENAEIIGFSTEKVKGTSQIKVNKVGDQANLRPLGCDSQYSRRDY